MGGTRREADNVFLQLKLKTKLSSMMGKSSFETVRKTVRQFLPLRKTVSQLSFMFFELLAPDSLASLNEAYFHREMSNSQRRGVLLMIPRRLQSP